MKKIRLPHLELQLQTRIFIIFFFVMAICIAYAYAYLTHEVNEQFRHYDALSKERSVVDIVNHLESVYQYERSWNIRSGRDIVRYAMRNGQIVTLLNVQREVIWRMDRWSVSMSGNPSSPMRGHHRTRAERRQEISNRWLYGNFENFSPSTANNTHRMAPSQDAGGVPASPSGGFDPANLFEAPERLDFLDSLDYEEIERPILYDGRVVGYVLIGSYEQNTMHPEGLAVRQQLLWSLSGLSVIGLIAVGIMSMTFARLLSEPLRNLTRAAQAMQSGDLSQNIKDKSGTIEIATLTRALNYLAFSLSEQRALRKRLTSDISHELRTPLNGLLALSEAYIDGVIPATPESMQSFRNEIVRLASLVGELGKINDLEDDQLKLSQEHIHVNDVLQELVVVYEQLSHKSGLTFRTSIEDNLVITADADRFKQALINLISNAIKYTPRGGSIELKAFFHDSSIHILVCDTGYGIAGEEKSRIFERFYRLEQSRNRGTGGAGLGLTLVKRIADAHSWQITVADNTPQGSIFSLMIPTH
jgi:two-component system, OmpR family, sensor histidine kinase BaeS